MALKDLNLEEIDLRKIENEIEQRKKQILEEKQGYVRCLDIIPETLKVYVDEDYKEEAREIFKRIKKLKLQNIHAAHFVKEVRRLALSFGLPLERSGTIKDNPEKLRLSYLEDSARSSIERLKHENKHGTLTEEKKQALESEIFRNEDMLKRIALAKKEISTLHTQLIEEEKLCL